MPPLRLPHAFALNAQVVAVRVCVCVCAYPARALPPGEVWGRGDVVRPEGQKNPSSHPPLPSLMFLS